MKRFLEFLNEISREKMKDYENKAIKNRDEHEANYKKHNKQANRHIDAYYSKSYNSIARYLPKFISRKTDSYLHNKIDKHMNTRDEAGRKLVNRRNGVHRVQDKLIRTGNKSGQSTEKLNRYVPKAETSSSHHFTRGVNLHHRTADLGTGDNLAFARADKHLRKSARRDSFVQRAKNVVEKRQKDKLKKHFPDNVKE